MKKLVRESLPELIGGLGTGLIAGICSVLYGLFDLDLRPQAIFSILAILAFIVLGSALIYVLRAKEKIDTVESRESVPLFKGHTRFIAVTIIVVIGLAIVLAWPYFPRGGTPFTKVGGILILRITGDTPNNSLRRDLVNTLNKELIQGVSTMNLGIEIAVHSGTIDETLISDLKSAHDRARKIGKEQKATLVIWGARIEDKKFHPRITIVDERMRGLVDVEHTVHAQNISEIDLPPEIVDQPLYLTLFVSGCILFYREKYDEAIVCFEAALEKATLRESTTNRVQYNSALFIGASFLEKSKYRQSAEAFRKALSFAANGIDSSTSLNNLAMSLSDSGNVAAAEPLFRLALEIIEKQLGPEHPDVAFSLNNLACLFLFQNNYAAAEPLFRRALKICEKKLDPEHSTFAMSLNNLASLLNAQGRNVEAEPLFRRALEIREKRLGQHLGVAVSLTNLANSLHAQGKYYEAELLLRRALEIQEKELGAENPIVAMSLIVLARSLYAQDKYAETESLLRRALEIQEKELGPKDFDVVENLVNLAKSLHAQGKYAEAEPLLSRAIRIKEKELGTEDLQMVNILMYLAITFHSQGKHAEAEFLLRRVVKIWEKDLGTEDPIVAISLIALAISLHAQGKYAEVEPLLRRALKIYEKERTQEHTPTKVARQILESLQRKLH